MTTEEVVEGLAVAIEERRRELGLTPSDFVKATGLTAPGLSPLRKGYRRAYQDRLKFAVCDALGWRRDSIDRLLRGESPIVIEQFLMPGTGKTATAAGVARMGDDQQIPASLHGRVARLTPEQQAHLESVIDKLFPESKQQP